MKDNRAKIAIIGRENVGKSTLFNRLIEKNQAIVSNVAGTTRDRNYGEALWCGKYLTFIDTAGFDIDSKNKIKDEALKQLKKAIKEAQLLLLVVDAQTGIMPEDYELAELIHNSKKPYILVVNKADNQILKNESHQFEKLGLKNPLAVSASNGSGTGDLLDLILKKLSKKTSLNFNEDIKEDALKIAFLGQPNVGKSSLINSILNEDRVIVSDLAYTTRESNSINFNYKNKNFELIDTAGIRKKINKPQILEKKSVEKSKQSLKQADIIVLTIEAQKEIHKQDIYLAGLAQEEHKGIIIVVNKWDLIKNKEANTINQEEKRIREIFKFIKWAPIIFTSAKKHLRVNKILDTALKIKENRHRKIQNKELEILLERALKKNPPPYINNPKIKALEEIDIDPPTFLIVAKFPKKIHFSYLRYIENQIRKKYDFTGTAIRFVKRNLR